MTHRTTDQVMASPKCPLCGVDTPHEHSPVERVIFRNGQKDAIARLSTPKAFLHPATGFVIAASDMKKHEERRLQQHQDPFYYVPLFEKPVLP